LKGLSFAITFRNGNKQTKNEIGRAKTTMKTAITIAGKAIEMNSCGFVNSPKTKNMMICASQINPFKNESISRFSVNFWFPLTMPAMKKAR
jgi:hypothetical protein